MTGVRAKRRQPCAIHAHPAPALHGEVFYPSEEVVAQANVKDYAQVVREAERDLEGFWARQAEELEWFVPWERVLDDSQAPFFKWFVGAKTNIVYNALERHVNTWRRNKLALIWEGEPGDQRTFSYYSLNREVCKFATVLKSLGVHKGDRVTIYMGRIPEIGANLGKGIKNFKKSFSEVDPEDEKKKAQEKT
jgi:acetyl-CoA synthetase